MWNKTEEDVLLCPGCGRKLEEGRINRSDFDRCPGCRTRLRVVLFPAYFEDSLDTTQTADAALDQEAVCFYHEDKRADVDCDSCGRFICGLCKLDISDEEICPSCFESIEEEASDLQTEQVLYGKIALALSIIPVFCFWPLTVITAPASIFLATYHWNDSETVLNRVRWRNVLAALFSGLQVIGWIVGGITLL